MTVVRLPKFTNPPVVEVALSVQFQPPAGLSVAHLGLFWGRCRDRFPRIEQHGPIVNIIERRGVRSPPVDNGQLSLSVDLDTIPRLWMINESFTELLQLQSDRFVRNWRRYHDHSIPYPSFEARIRPEFQKDYEAFSNFAGEQGWEDLTVNQCEVTYINHIAAGKIWQSHDQLDRVFKGWSSTYPPVAGSKAESIGVRLRHELVDGSGKFLGRLHVDVNSGFIRKDEAPVFVLQLAARGQPLGAGVSGVMRFLDYGHEVIVSSFAELTTADMHRIWGRTQ